MVETSSTALNVMASWQLLDEISIDFMPDSEEWWSPGSKPPQPKEYHHNQNIIVLKTDFLNAGDEDAETLDHTTDPQVNFLERCYR